MKKYSWQGDYLYFASNIDNTFQQEPAPASRQVICLRKPHPPINNHPWNVICSNFYSKEGNAMARNSGQNGGIWARAAVCGFLHNNRETYMAKSMASKKRSLPVDYTQLHSLSSVVLYDTSFKKSRGKLYDVERIIERRKTRYVSFSLYYLFHELLKGHFARIGR